MKKNRYARGEGNALKVTVSDDRVHLISHAALLRQRRSLVAQRDREMARLDAELANLDDMIEACDAMGIRGHANVDPAGTMDEPDATPPRASLGRRMWAALTKPRGFGQ